MPSAGCAFLRDTAVDLRSSSEGEIGGIVVSWDMGVTTDSDTPTGRSMHRGVTDEFRSDTSPILAS